MAGCNKASMNAAATADSVFASDARCKNGITIAKPVRLRPRENMPTNNISHRPQRQLCSCFRSRSTIRRSSWESSIRVKWKKLLLSNWAGPGAGFPRPAVLIAFPSSPFAAARPTQRIAVTEGFGGKTRRTVTRFGLFFGSLSPSPKPVATFGPRGGRGGGRPACGFGFAWCSPPIVTREVGYRRPKLSHASSTGTGHNWFSQRRFSWGYQTARAHSLQALSPKHLKESQARASSRPSSDTL